MWVFQNKSINFIKVNRLIFQNMSPTKNWEVVAVDLFGPMPSSNHVVVVQDLVSR